MLNTILDEFDGQIATMSHITGGGIAANLSRVLPAGVALEVERDSWNPLPVFRVLAEWGGHRLNDLEGTWNLGLGFALVVRAAASEQISARLSTLGIAAWPLGQIVAQPTDLGGFTTEAKGTIGGAVRLTGNYQN